MNLSLIINKSFSYPDGRVNYFLIRSIDDIEYHYGKEASYAIQVLNEGVAEGRVLRYEPPKKFPKKYAYQMVHASEQRPLVYRPPQVVLARPSAVAWRKQEKQPDVSEEGVAKAAEVQPEPAEEPGQAREGGFDLLLGKMPNELLVALVKELARQK